MFRSLSYRCQPMTKHKNVTNGNLKKVKVKLCWLLISSISPPLLPSGLPATSSSASHCDPALLLPLLHLKPIGGYHPHNWCLVKFRFRIHNNISLAWSDPNCLVDLPFEAAVETSSHNHWEDLLLTTMYQLAMLPEWRLFSLIHRTPIKGLLYQRGQYIKTKNYNDGGHFEPCNLFCRVKTQRRISSFKKK